MMTPKRIAALSVLTALPLTLWLSGASAGTPLYTQEPNVLKKAELMLSRGEADATIDLLDARVDDLRRPSYRSKGHALLCTAQYQKRNYVAAEEHCNLAVTLARPNWSLLNNRGVMRFSLGRYQDALIDFNQALSIMSFSAPRAQKSSVKSNIESAQRRAMEALKTAEVSRFPRAVYD